MCIKSEKDKMLLGELYYSNDQVLCEDRKRAKQILQEFNNSSPWEGEKRLDILKNILGSTTSNIEIEPPFYCDYGYNLYIGDKFYANYNCIILDCAKVTIGNNVFLGPNVQIYTATHPLNPEERNKGLESANPINIADNVWIGGSSVINPGVSIGAGSTIGSGSVVTKDIPENVVAAGNPCRILKYLS